MKHKPEELVENMGLRGAIELAEYRATGLSPEEVAELAKAKGEGRLVVLPCKVGDTVYRVCRVKKNPTAKEAVFVRSVVLNRNNLFRIVFGGEWNNTVFLTRAEADAVLVVNA